MPGHKAHPGNVPLLPAQPKLPLEPSPSSLPCCRRSGREKESHSSRSSCTRLFIQPWHSSARMCRGEAAAAAHPAPGANHDLPAAAWAGTGAPAPSPRPREGNQAGTAGSDASGTGAAPEARLARAAARHRGAKARSRPRCHPPWRWGDPGLSQPWDGARGNRAAGKAPAASCSQRKRARHGWEAATASRAPAPAPRDAPASPPAWICPQGGQCPPEAPEGRFPAIPSRPGWQHMAQAFCCGEEHLARCCPAAQDYLQAKEPKVPSGSKQSPPHPKNQRGNRSRAPTAAREV